MAADQFLIELRGPNLETAYASPIFTPENGADKDSQLRHKRKKKQPLRRLRDEDGKASSDGRNRRLYASSDDDGSLTDDGFINHDFWVETCVHYPPHPTKWMRLV